MYKCHGVGRNRFRAGKLFRDFLQSPCFIEGKNLSLEKLKWLTKDYWIHVTVKVKISGVCSGRGWAGQEEARSNLRNSHPHLLNIIPGPGIVLNAVDALDHRILTNLNDRCYHLSPEPASRAWENWSHRETPIQKGLVSLDTILKFFIIFEQGTPYFHFILSPTNYVASPHYLHVIDMSANRGFEKLNDMLLVLVTQQRWGHRHIKSADSMKVDLRKWLCGCCALRDFGISVYLLASDLSVPWVGWPTIPGCLELWGIPKTWDFSSAKMGKVSSKPGWVSYPIAESHAWGSRGFICCAMFCTYGAVCQSPKAGPIQRTGWRLDPGRRWAAHWLWLWN